MSGSSLSLTNVDLGGRVAVDLVGADASFCAILSAGTVACWGKSGDLSGGAMLKMLDASSFA